MARTILIFLLLALVALALIPNPQRGICTANEWGNVQPYHKAEPTIVKRILSTVGLTIPGELIPGLGIIGISLIIRLLK